MSAASAGTSSSIENADRREDDERRNHRPGREAVEPVGKIDGVDRPRDRQDAEHEPQPVRHK